MKSRKTVEINSVLKTANHFLATSPDASKGERQGVINLANSLLHESGNYRGFAYIEGKGIVRNPDPHGFHVYPDETRLQFIG